MLRQSKLLWVTTIVVVLVLANIFSPLKVRQISIRLSPEVVFRLGGLAVTNTLLCGWVAVILLIVLGAVVRRRLVDVPAPRSLQNVIEILFEALYNFMRPMVGDKARSFFPIVATFFGFILTCNWLGMLPGFGSIGFWEQQEEKRIFIPLLRGATSDLNTTVALAVASVLSCQIYGIRYLGFRDYISRFVPIYRFMGFFKKPLKAQIGALLEGFLDVFIGFLEIFDELTKVLSFSFRLFGNIFGGEVLLLVMAFLAPYVASIPFLALELFGGFIQAFIFAVLTTAFLGRATEPPLHDMPEGTGESTHPKRALTSS